MSAPSAEELSRAARYLVASKMYSLASCVMLFYDIAITFGDEVEKIWKQPFTGATVLWFLNRYLAPLGYVVIIVSFHDPTWSLATCNRYVLYPEILKLFMACIIGLIFILRLYSIFMRSRLILFTFALLLAAELSVKIWAFRDGTSLSLPPGLVGCILTAKHAAGTRFVYSWVVELVFDSAVFFVTLYRTVLLYRQTSITETQSLLATIGRDGLLYFGAIFLANAITVAMFIFATPELKAINASFSTLITSLMVSRLMLNLRGVVLRRSPVAQNIDAREYCFDMCHLTVPHLNKTVEDTIIGNLGAPIGVDDEFDEFDDTKSAPPYEAEETHRAPERAKSPPLVVEIRQEVVVDGPSTATGAGPMLSGSPSSAQSRQSWEPPRSWQLARDVEQMG